MHWPFPHWSYPISYPQFPWRLVAHTTRHRWIINWMAWILILLVKLPSSLRHSHWSPCSGIPHFHLYIQELLITFKDINHWILLVWTCFLPFDEVYIALVYAVSTRSTSPTNLLNYVTNGQQTSCIPFFSMELLTTLNSLRIINGSLP